MLTLRHHTWAYARAVRASPPAPGQARVGGPGARARAAAGARGRGRRGAGGGRRHAALAARRGAAGRAGGAAAGRRAARAARRAGAGAAAGAPAAPGLPARRPAHASPVTGGDSRVSSAAGDPVSGPRQGAAHGLAGSAPRLQPSTASPMPPSPTPEQLLRLASHGNRRRRAQTASCLTLPLPSHEQLSARPRGAGRTARGCAWRRASGRRAARLPHRARGRRVRGAGARAGASGRRGRCDS